MTLLIYGANGYTGQLTARMAAANGMRPVLAGRSEAPVRALAAELGFEHRAFPLDDPAKLAEGLSGVSVVLHCAGPFSRTARPMVEACLRRRAHYLDITGEIEVFEDLASLDGRARTAGIMVLPGAGFDVVPSDCLAAHVAGRLPNARRLVLAIAPIGGAISHGTATTMVENLHRGGAIRRGGRIVPIPSGSLARRFDFGRGSEPAVAIPWGDVSTAWRSTGIPDIEVYARAPRAAIYGMRMGSLLGPALGWAPVQKLLKSRVDARPAGPTDEQRAKGRTVVLAEAEREDGTRVASRLDCQEGYTFTAVASLEIARRVMAGDAPGGYQTPSLAYGAGFVSTLPGVTVTDLA